MGPRSFLENPDEFGVVDAPAHATPVGITEAGQLAASLAQHHAARVIRVKRDAGKITVRDLAEATGASEGGP